MYRHMYHVVKYQIRGTLQCLSQIIHENSSQQLEDESFHNLTESHHEEKERLRDNKFELDM